MKFFSTLSKGNDLEQAFEEAASEIHSGLDDRSPHILMLFVGGYPFDKIRRLPPLLTRHFPSSLVLGCTAGGVIGAGRELEHQPALSVTGAILPEVQFSPFHLETEDLQALEKNPERLDDLLKIHPEKKPNFILIPDPFSFDPQQFLHAMDLRFPESPKIGGLASGGRQPGDNLLFLGGETFTTGLVGVALHGNLTIDTIVAQGCRPIGVPMFVTKCHEHLLFELDGRPATEVLEELFHQLNDRDKILFQHSLFLGIVMREHQREYGQGDFLIRNLMGLVEGEKALMLGAQLKENQVVQFHLRDAKTSAEDLEELCGEYQKFSSSHSPPEGALLFSCLGRGIHLYGETDHDSKTLQRHLGPVPVGGFFCNGEIGPIHGQTFLHGYTSSFGIFRRKK